MNAKTYLDIHSFSNKKKQQAIDAYNPLFTFNGVPGYNSPSGKRAVISFAQYKYNLLSSRQFYLDANKAAYDQNYQVIEGARELAGSMYAKPLGVIIDPIFLPAAAVAVEIAAVVLYVEHKALEWAINHYFSE